MRYNYETGLNRLAKLIIIRSNSGSGKTSVSKALQEKFGENTMLISQDTVRREILRTRDGADTKALPLMTELLKYGRRNSPVTIMEGIMVAEWYMPLFEAAIEEFGSEIYAYYYDLPFEETVARHGTRDKRTEFGAEDMRRWWAENDYMKIMPEKIFTKETGLDESVEMIFRDVNGNSENIDRKSVV